MNKYLSSKIVKARKCHICCICNTLIPIAEKYESRTIVIDGDIRTLHTCLDCMNFINQKCNDCKDRHECFEDTSGIYECMLDKKNN
jgi:hypothetical protein